MRSIPLGNDDFKDIRDNNGYFVDKSMLIEGIVKSPTTKVFLFTRPRRFGKSLGMSMIDAFFNVRYEGNTWFDDLHVSDCKECSKERNRYPVIFLNMKNLVVNDSASFRKSMAETMESLYQSYRYLLDSEVLNSDYKEKYRAVTRFDYSKISLERTLLNLSEMLRIHHGMQVIILIDEYDNPIQRTYGTDVQGEVITFMRDFMSPALKSNDALKFGVVTGVMQIAKESIFSGLNNLSTNNVLDKKFDECFGFTEAEVRELISYYGHPEKFDECKEWYDGYIFGDEEVYNPWSLLRYIDSGFEPGRYWAGGSGNDIIGTLLQTDDRDVYDELRIMASGGSIRRYVDPFVVYSDIETKVDVIYSVMVMSGYLKAKRTKDGFELSIPNKEVFEVYSDMLLSPYGGDRMAFTIRNLFRSIQAGDVDGITDRVRDLMRSTVSAKILDSEHAYQTYIIGMMMGFCGNYEIYGDRLESGDGFADIIFRKIRGPGPNIVMELKRSDSEKDMEKDSESALRQIIDKDYMHDMSGRTLLYGVAFHSKKSHIVYIDM